MNPSGDPVEELFSAAVDLPDVERRRLLDDRCGTNPELRREVELLLRADVDAAPSFLERPASRIEGAYLGPGTQLGRYRILERIGEGGMGTIYAARQESPERDVAIKVIRPDRFSPETLRRFRHEIKILGWLQHSGIAQVFEAGSAEVELPDGTRLEQPYLAMELVRGVPLLDYVRDRDLPRRSRIELVARICDIVHYAHQQGVIHRDLKPENVLVSEDADEPAGTPKVLDFGVARAIEPDADALTIDTLPGQLVGSLASMSPEQVSGDRRQVDARTDVYALGVLLYRLLAGRFPVVVTGCSLPEAVRRISSGEVGRLSSTDPSLRGDLTVIASRALDVDPDRRYASAGEMGGDLRRYLEGAPIVARTDSTLYVLGKAMRRHRTISLAAGTVLAFLIAFAILSSMQARRLQQELTANTIERGRLVGAAGNFLLAEEMLWRAFLRDPDSRHAYWALWELYSRDPCLGSWSVDLDITRALAIHPDGSFFASGARGQQLVLWDAAGRGVIDTLEVGSPVDAVAFSPLGDRMAAGTSAGTLSFWSMPEGRVLREVQAHEGQVLALAYTPTGDALASAGADGVVRVWSADGSGSPIELEGHRRAVQCLAIRDGLLASAGDSGQVLLWRDLRSPPVLRIATDQRVVRSLAFSRDGGTLASGGDSRDVLLWSTHDGSSLGRLSAHNGSVRFLRFHPDRPQTLLASGWWKGLAWDLGTSEHEVLVGHGFHHGALHERSDRLVAAGERHLRLWDLRPMSGIRLTGLEGGCATAVDPFTGRVAAADVLGALRLYDLETGPLEFELEGDRSSIGTLAFQPHGPLLAVGLATEILLIDTREPSVALTLEGHSNVTGRSFAFSPDGRRLAHTSRGRVRVRDVETGEVSREIEVTRYQALGVAFSPDGGKLATTFRTYSPPEFGIRVWSDEGEKAWECLTSPTMFGQDSGLDIIPLTPVFSDDGACLAAGGWGNLIFVWNARTGAIRSVLRDHGAAVWDVAFRPGGHDTLASVSDDGTVKLWDVGEERCLATLVSPEDEGRSTNTVAFGPDGDTLVVAGQGGATVWDLTYFDRHVAGNLSFQLERLGSSSGIEADPTGLRSWADEVLDRPWPRFERARW